jgi:hypothetical protein
MRVRVTTTFAVAAALLALSAAAGAAASPLTTLKVRACQTGDAAKQRQATFYGRMRAVAGTSRMMMRFALIDRATQRASLVAAPQLSHWHRSRLGVKNFGWAQTVTGLQPGGSYAAVVEFRWVDANGKTVRSGRRTSEDCRQDGKLPNLTITRVAARPGGAAGAELYSIDVANTGAAEARAVSVGLFVDNAGADATRLDLIRPGETVTVRISGPVCVQRLRVAVDRLDSIHETNENDNVWRSGCPVPAG